MDPHAQFCLNSACPARGRAGQGNIIIHSQREQRYRCTLCGRTFSARTGTPFYRKHYPAALITQVVTLVAHGCPEAAIVVAFDLHPARCASGGRRRASIVRRSSSTSWSSLATWRRCRPMKSA